MSEYVLGPGSDSSSLIISAVRRCCVDLAVEEPSSEDEADSLEVYEEF